MTTTIGTLLGADDFFDQEVLVSYPSRHGAEPFTAPAASLPKFLSRVAASASTALLATVLTIPPSAAEASLLVRGEDICMSGARKESTPDAFSELADLHRLRGNWDSYGADPPSDEVILKAEELYSQLLNEAFRQHVAVPEPAVQASGAGTVGLAWGEGLERSLEVEVHGDRTLTFVVAEGDRLKSGVLKSPKQLLSLLLGT